MLSESIHAGEFLLSEGNGSISREKIVVNSGENLVAGTVVGKITATGKYAAYNDANSDGTEVADGILYDAVDASAGDQYGVIIARLAEVVGDSLTGNDAAGTVDLAALNIIVR